MRKGGEEMKKNQARRNVEFCIAVCYEDSIDEAMSTSMAIEFRLTA